MLWKQIDNYLLVAALGSGSLGDVYEAETTTAVSQTAVIKLIDPQLLSKPDVIAQLKALAQRQSRLADDNSHILPYTLHESNGSIYLRMPHIPAGSLHKYLDILRQQKEGTPLIPEETAVSLINRLIDKLTAFQDAGFHAHGGLHPKNILLITKTVAQNEQTIEQPIDVILSDFGQADLRRRVSANDVFPSRDNAPYIPSQLFPDADGNINAPLDQRADLYALGHLLDALINNAHSATDDQSPINYDNWQQQLQPEGQKPAIKDLVETALQVYRLVDGETAVPSPNTLLNQWQTALQTRVAKTALKQLALPPVQISLPNKAPVSTQPQSVQQAAKSTSFIIINLKETDQTKHISGYYPRLFEIRPEQQRITVGGTAENDIMLANLSDDQSVEIMPLHFHLQQQNATWNVTNHGNIGTVTLGEASLLPDQPEPWPNQQTLTIGNYLLHLETPSKIETLSDFTVNLLPDIKEVTPGFLETVGISIRNTGKRGYFKVQIEVNDSTLPSQSIRLLQDGVILNNSDQRELPLELSPTPDLVGGDVHYKVVVSRLSDQSNQRHFQVAKGIMRVNVSSAYSTELQVVQGSNNGRFYLSIHNHGNQEVHYKIQSEDETDALRFAPLTADYFTISSKAIDQKRPLLNQTQQQSRNLRTAMSRLRLTGLLNRLQPYRQLRGVTATASRTRQQQAALSRLAGIAPTKTQARSQSIIPSRPQKQLTKSIKPSFQESFDYELMVAPREWADVLIAVESRKRPLQYTSTQTYPFALTITPQNGPIPHRIPQTQTGTLAVTSRFSWASWLLTIGLLLLLCMGLTAWSIFLADQNLAQVRAAQSTGQAFYLSDTEQDGIYAIQEVATWGIDPENPDSDGDGVPDGVETDPTVNTHPALIDTNFDGTPDSVELPFPTATPTPLGGLPFPTAQMPATPTAIPTIPIPATPIPDYVFTWESISRASSSPDQPETITIGDTKENEPLVHTLQFPIVLPPTASITDAQLVLVMASPNQLSSVTLGKLYLTVGRFPPDQLLALFNDEATAPLIINMHQHENLLIATIDDAHQLNGQENLTITIHFENATDLDDSADSFTFYSENPPPNQHAPFLHLTYQVTAQETP